MKAQRKAREAQTSLIPAATSAAHHAPVAPATGLTLIPEAMPDPRVRKAKGIYELTSGITMVSWLCAEHLKSRTAPGVLSWTAKRIGDVDGDCDDCRLAVTREESAA